LFTAAACKSTAYKGTAEQINADRLGGGEGDGRVNSQASAGGRQRGRLRLLVTFAAQRSKRGQGADPARARLRHRAMSLTGWRSRGLPAAGGDHLLHEAFKRAMFDRAQRGAREVRQEIDYLGPRTNARSVPRDYARRAITSTAGAARGTVHGDEFSGTAPAPDPTRAASAGRSDLCIVLAAALACYAIFDWRWKN